MSWIRRAATSVKAPEVAISISLNKQAFVCGEPVTGTLQIASSETFDAKGICIELQAIETIQPLTMSHQAPRESEPPKEAFATQLYKTRVSVCGSLKITSGYRKEFPFSVRIPPSAPPTYRGRNANNTWILRGLISVSGRRDAEGKTEVLVTPSVFCWICLKPIAQDEQFTFFENSICHVACLRKMKEQ